MIARWQGILLASAALVAACEPSSEQKKNEAIAEQGAKASQTAKEALSSNDGMSTHQEADTLKKSQEK